MKRKAYDGIYNQYIKRGIDFCLALVGLIIAAIPMAIVAVAIKAESKGPVIFKQDRIGYKGKVYKMYKFRSMCVGAEKGGVYSDNKDSRVTKVGKFIRATSIDELPQLVNILKGDMALIGFRSPLTYHPWPWSEYTEEQKIRAIVLMGNKTFGATGTNTVVLFLEKYNEPPKKADLIEDSIDAVFNGCNLDGWEDKAIVKKKINRKVNKRVKRKKAGKIRI